ncbi:hypothetical protein TWF788_003241 [Orbilia oligospora]|uniref:Uncharacterized protein n=1 Tax=Orbilia oligospora TaxID=2813651 RepID=A0A7C8U7L8_ORBOL|nr:hypothetical protein TWF788_003241 [Orbilia oligospora]
MGTSVQVQNGDSTKRIAANAVPNTSLLQISSTPCDTIPLLEIEFGPNSDITLWDFPNSLKHLTCLKYLVVTLHGFYSSQCYSRLLDALMVAECLQAVAVTVESIPEAALWFLFSNLKPSQYANFALVTSGTYILEPPSILTQNSKPDTANAGVS